MTDRSRERCGAVSDWMTRQPATVAPDSSIGAALGLIPASVILLVVAAATAGALVESALGATLEGPGILNNDMLNFINTAVAAAIVLAIS